MGWAALPTARIVESEAEKLSEHDLCTVKKGPRSGTPTERRRGKEKMVEGRVGDTE